MSLVLRILLPILALGVLALLMILVPLPGGLPEPASKPRQRVAAIVVGGLAVLHLVLLSRHVALVVLEPGRRLAGVCSELGLAHSSDFAGGQACHGKIDGRSVAVRFVPGPAPGPMLVEVTFGFAGRHHLTISRGPALRDPAATEEISLDPAFHRALRAWTDDRLVARSWLDRPEVETVLRALTATGESDLMVRPDELYLRITTRQPDPDRVRTWLATLQTLASMLEPTPTERLPADR